MLWPAGSSFDLLRSAGDWLGMLRSAGGWLDLLQYAGRSLKSRPLTAAAAAIFCDVDLRVLSGGGRLVCFPGVGWRRRAAAIEVEVEVDVGGVDVIVVVLVERALWGCTGVSGRWVHHLG